LRSRISHRAKDRNNLRASTVEKGEEPVVAKNGDEDGRMEKNAKVGGGGGGGGGRFVGGCGVGEWLREGPGIKSHRRSRAKRASRAVRNLSERLSKIVHRQQRLPLAAKRKKEREGGLKRQDVRKDLGKCSWRQRPERGACATTQSERGPSLRTKRACMKQYLRGNYLRRIAGRTAVSCIMEKGRKEVNQNGIRKSQKGERIQGLQTSRTWAEDGAE